MISLQINLFKLFHFIHKFNLQQKWLQTIFLRVFLSRPYFDPFFPPVSVGLIIPTLVGSVIVVALWARTYYLVRLDRSRDCLKKQE